LPITLALAVGSGIGWGVDDGRIGAPAGERPSSIEQVRRLLHVVRAEDTRFFTHLHLALMTGARRSQLPALRWSDVDFHHPAIGCCRALVDGPTGS